MKLTAKNKYLIGGIVLMLFLSYKLALERTISAKNTLQQTVKKIESAAIIQQRLAFLSKQEKVLSTQLEELDLEKVSMQNNLLIFLNEKAIRNKVKIIEFNAPHEVMLDNNKVSTYIFTLSGGYLNILKTLHSLENDLSFGTVTHVGFEKKKDFKTKKNNLYAQIFLEQTH